MKFAIQCPYIPQRIETLRAYCAEKGIPARFVQADSLEKAKALPCPFNNWAVFYRGRFQTVNQIDIPTLERILKKELWYDGSTIERGERHEKTGVL